MADFLACLRIEKKWKNCVPKILGRNFSLGRILKIAEYKIEWLILNKHE